jgi:hypothetical protein
MSAIAKEISTNLPISSRIEDLGFVKVRIPYVAMKSNQPADARRKADRTTAIVRRWQDLTQDLQFARSQTLQCCEARPGKGDIVTLAIVDRAQFDSLQSAIQEHVSQLANIEDALRKLDSMGAGWHSDLKDECGQYGRVESNERARISQMSAFYVQKARNKSPEDALKDPDAIRLRGDMEDAIIAANAKLAELRPKLDQMNVILESVGC